jgi:hypothetical protein
LNRQRRSRPQRLGRALPGETPRFLVREEEKLL